jgi:fructose-1,6-bisphosphatase/inositol monophosphatase family enzyme
LTPHDLAALIAILRHAARAEVMPRFRHLGSGDVRAKSGPLDLVTVADEAAERAITAALLDRFPGALIVGEEATAADPALPRRLADAKLAFVVDPIDGTSNYQAGVPLFAVMAAAIESGAVTAAAIHDPLGDDTACALAGQGAWMDSAAGRRGLRVAAPAPVAAMTGIPSWQFLPPPLRARVIQGLPRFAATWNYRCAGHEYRVAADGHCHFLLYNKLMPWDHAPGWLIHREAGGHAARFDGSAYSVAQTDGGLICAPDHASWQAIHDTLLLPTPPEA